MKPRELFVRSLFLPLLLLIAGGIRLPAQSTTRPVKQIVESITTERIKTDIQALSSVWTMGRDTGSIGYTRSAVYVEGQLQQMGALPLGDYGTFRQEISFKVAVPSLPAVFDVDGVALEWEDFGFYPDPNHTENEVEAEAVFVGRGLCIPNICDDYAGIDVKGKIVVLLDGVGTPKGVESDLAAWNLRPNVVFKNAADRGAVGVVAIPATPIRFQQLKANRTNKQILWMEPDGSMPKNTGCYTDSPQELKGRMLLRPTAAQRVFSGVLDVASLINQAKQGEIIAAKSTGKRFHLKTAQTHNELKGFNVVAVIPGSDVTLQAQAVCLSAHLDHLGTLGGKLHPGALDNASGSAALLEVARVVSSLPVHERPKRSLILLWDCAEELGLIGSNYFANHLPVAAKDVIADIDLDMCVALWESDKVVGFAAQHSTMDDTLREAGAVLGLKSVPDPIPNQMIFIRSDHLNFMQKGIPALFLMWGFEPGTPEAAAFDSFMSGGAYHSPGDNIAQPIRWEALRKFTQMNLAAVMMLGNTDHPPKWRETTEVGKMLAAEFHR